ncbi:MAG: DUF397 domain-containing protein [Actinomycetota bacterium]|nr:DUF397 domain-containing protein [Actinomycetota bacterium]
MNHPNPHTALHHAEGWFTSSRTGQGQNCVGITHAIPGWVGIRDSKQPHSTLLTTTHHWQTFLHHITTNPPQTPNNHTPPSALSRPPDKPSEQLPFPDQFADHWFNARSQRTSAPGPPAWHPAPAWPGSPSSRAPRPDTGIGRPKPQVRPVPTLVSIRTASVEGVIEVGRGSVLVGLRPGRAADRCNGFPQQITG